MNARCVSSSPRIFPGRSVLLSRALEGLRLRKPNPVGCDRLSDGNSPHTRRRPPFFEVWSVRSQPACPPNERKTQLRNCSRSPPPTHFRAWCLRAWVFKTQVTNAVCQSARITSTWGILRKRMDELRHVGKGPCVKHSYGGSDLTEMMPKPPLNRVANSRLSKPSQETVGPGFFGHAESPTFVGTNRSPARGWQ